MTNSRGQQSDGNLNKRWELNSIDSLIGGLGGIGGEMKALDLTSKTQLIFEGGGQSETIAYKVVDNEIRLLDQEGNDLGQDIIWKIEHVTADEFTLLFIAREDNERLARLTYRAKG